jgi:hypothetical protein
VEVDEIGSPVEWVERGDEMDALGEQPGVAVEVVGCTLSVPDLMAYSSIVESEDRLDHEHKVMLECCAPSLCEWLPSELQVAT